jgi:ferredoxin
MHSLPVDTLFSIFQVDSFVFSPYLTELGMDSLGKERASCTYCTQAIYFIISLLEPVLISCGACFRECPVSDVDCHNQQAWSSVAYDIFPIHIGKPKNGTPYGYAEAGRREVNSTN